MIGDGGYLKLVSLSDEDADDDDDDELFLLTDLLGLSDSGTGGGTNGGVSGFLVGIVLGR